MRFIAVDDSGELALAEYFWMINPHAGMRQAHKVIGGGDYGISWPTGIL